MRRTSMQPNISLPAFVLATLFGVMPLTCAHADSGGVVLDRHGGHGGLLLVTPVPRGAPLHRRYVIDGPLLAPRPDPRYGHYARPGLGYGGLYYGAGPNVVYEIPYPEHVYCPESRAYYPAVRECATPWLRMRPGGGVRADSPIPMPGDPPYGR